ncbi:MAG: SCP2 sterol-binding domain-containing protein [Parvularculaceae bacterium]
METANALIENARAAFAAGFGAVLAIEAPDAATIYVDGRNDTCSLTAVPPDAPAACVWRASTDTLLRIFEGGRALESAYLSGRLKISGDMSVMARLKLESSR